MNMKNSIFLMMFSLIIMLSSCQKGTGVFLFSVQDDIDLGAQVDAEIKGSGEFNILDRNTNQEAYAYLEAMKNEILEGGEVNFKDEFVWDLNIIDDDNTLNAFCTPGGYIYVYTGLIKYLENSSSLAGVMGHEIAHADRRHSSKQLQQTYGISMLLSLLSSTTGDNGELLGKIAGTLTTLAFSRADETQADEYSVKYLCPTDFDAAGAANFFQKIIDEGNPSPPAFLSTHPSPDNRVSKIHENSEAGNCAPEEVDPMINGVSYTDFQLMF